jgi:N-acetylmuramoyl-L-alanine amidase
VAVLSTGFNFFMRTFLTLAIIVFLHVTLGTGQAQARKSGPKRSVAIDMVVIHSTGGPTCDEKGKPIWVSAGAFDDNMRTIEAHPRLGIHYMIDRDGSLRSSIPEVQVAHHVLTYSQRSIAIELINDGDGKDPFTQPQLDSLVNLLKGIVQRHAIKPSGIKRHSDLDKALSDCDPGKRRKVDPGAAFPMQSIVNRVFQ